MVYIGVAVAVDMIDQVANDGQIYTIAAVAIMSKDLSTLHV